MKKLKKILHSLLKSFDKYTTPTTLNSFDGLPYWREKILLYFMYTLMLTAGLAYIPSIILSIAEELWLIVFFDTFAYIFMIYIFRATYLSVRFRAISILTMSYFLGIFLLIAVGPYGAGYIWMFIIPILASILSDIKTAVATIIINMLSLILIGILFQYGIISGYGRINFSMSSWLVIVSNFVFLEIMITLSIIMITNGLEKTLVKEKEIIRSLEMKSNELINAKEEAEKANSLKSEFLAQMSHEVRSPINTILGSVSMLKENLNSFTKEEIEDVFAIINRGSNRVIRTIDSILNMSEIHTGSFHVKYEPIFIITDVIKPVVAELKHLAENKRLSLELIVPSGEDFLINSDRYATTQIFVNLIDNAIKYTQKGGIKIIVELSNDFVVVHVKDTGIGMSKEYMENIFKPFSQEEGGYSRRFEGNGLGLALVKKYCELNNASIAVKSIKDEGSKFSISFPSSSAVLL